MRGIHFQTPILSWISSIKGEKKFFVLFTDVLRKFLGIKEIEHKSESIYL